MDLEAAACKARLVVVLPEGGRSYWVNAPGDTGERYEDHIIEDVVPFAERTFPIASGRAGRAIGGLSMGGYGAMMLAMRHPETFAAAVSMSGALYFAAMEHPLGRSYPTALMNSLPEGEYDCFALAEKIAGLDAPRRPEIAMTCGRDDYLLEPNRKFHEHLEKHSIKHAWAEHEGSHDWDFWRARTPEMMQFVRERVSPD
jgi:S-formylglutathione hydrolase FrmB